MEPNMKKSSLLRLSWNRTHHLSPWKGAALIGAFTFLLAACGDTVENTTISQMGMEVVEKVDDLPKCTKDNEGEQAFVKGEATPRICVDKKWYAAKDSAVASDLSCSTKQLKDKSGIKIICNGDSIGVVKNGKDGEQGIQGETGADGKDGSDGKDGAQGIQGEKGDPGEAGAAGKDGSGCTIEKNGAKLAITCGDKSVTLELGEDGSLIGGEEVVLDSEKVAVQLDTVSGVSQKGPFLSGAKVIAFELEDGRTLKQTGSSFSGKISNDLGQFKISARLLTSQYVKLEATGYYRNEVTGKNSSSNLTLSAITDVNMRSVANVNLLTHLEYDRVYYLVTKKKMKVSAAKRQAQREIFAILDIDATGFSNSEDLNIAGASDEDGALLAFSAMFQGDRTVAQLTELLTNIANDMEEDGKWDDAATKMAIADWSADADSSGRLDTIRQNVANWKLSSMVPKFEPFVRHFWSKEYGLDSCKTDSVDVVKAATAGKRKGTKTRYICKEIGELTGDYRWVIASDIEKDTYKWKKDTTDGALKAGDVTGTKYVFDKTGSYNGASGWRPAVAVENVYGGCRETLYDSIRTYRGTTEAGFYQCQKTTHKWLKTNNSLMIDTQGWKEGDDGFSKWGDSIGVVPNTGSRICYVYDTSAAYNGWRTGNVNDCSLNIMGCTKGRTGTYLTGNDTRYYNCKDDIWTEVIDEIERNTHSWNCKDTNAGELKHGLQDDLYFVCNVPEWRKASIEEELACRTEGVCRICTDGMQGITEDREGVMYVCDKENWREFNCAEKIRGVCTANDSSLVESCETVGTFELDYTCSDDHWHAVHHPFEYTLAQWNAKRDAFNVAAVEAKVNSDSMITDPRDGNTYRTVVINGKRVFAENLRYADSVTYVNLKDQTSCYNNDPKNCEIGGRYYTWTAAVDLNSQWQRNIASALIKDPHQGICPEGWHVPSSSEWNALFSDIGYAAQQAMGYSGWTEATDASGFSALPVGFNDYRGNFGGAGSGVNFWSATEINNAFAYRWSLNAIDASLLKEYMVFGKSYGFAVRCFQDSE